MNEQDKHHPAYAGGALSPKHHHRIVADLEGFAKDAGIQKHWITTKLSSDFSAEEREYMIRFKHYQHEGKVAGLCYVGNGKGIEMRMSALAGCLVRNFVRARVMTLGNVIESTIAHSLPDLSCVLIPNFFMADGSSGMIAKWQLAALYDFMIDRSIRGRQTILFVKDLDELGTQYGANFRALVDDSYLRVSV